MSAGAFQSAETVGERLESRIELGLLTADSDCFPPIEMRPRRREI